MTKGRYPVIVVADAGTVGELTGTVTLGADGQTLTFDQHPFAGGDMPIDVTFRTVLTPDQVNAHWVASGNAPAPPDPGDPGDPGGP